MALVASGDDCIPLWSDPLDSLTGSDTFESQTAVRCRSHALDPGLDIQEAWNGYLRNLEHTERQKFEENGTSNVQQRLADICKQYETQNRKSLALKLSSRIQPIAETVNMYMPGALQVAQVYPNPALLILGGIVCVLQVQANLQKHVTEVTRRLARMTDMLNITRRISVQIFQKDSDLQLALTNLYGTVLEYCNRVHRLVTHTNGKTRGKFRQVLTSLHKPAHEQDSDIDAAFSRYYENFFQLLQIYDRNQTQLNHRRTRETQDLMRHFGKLQSQRFDQMASNGEAIKERVEQSDRIAQADKLLERKYAISASIQKVDYLSFYDHLSYTRVNGTGEWLLEDPSYDTWRNSTDTSILRLTGEESSGKTYLAATVIDDLQLERSYDTAVIFHFFTRASPETCQTRIFLGSLLHQLLQQAPGFGESIQDMYFSGNQTLSTLYKSLSGQLESFKTVFVVVDGLDECENQKQITDELLRFVQIAEESRLRLKLLAISRDGYPTLNKILDNADHHIRIKTETNKLDMQLFIDEKVSFETLRSLGEHSLLTSEQKGNELHHARQALTTQSDGRFIYASLMSQSLTEAESPLALKKALDDLPDGLIGTYDAKLDEMDKKLSPLKRRRAHKIILYTYWSQRPLTRQEMLMALAVEPGMTSLSLEAVGGDISDALEICQNLIKLDAQECFALCHGSFARYLDSSKREWDVAFILETKSISGQDLGSHDGLASLCLTYLSLNDFVQSEACKFADLVKRHSLVEYAASYWDKHVRKVDPDAIRDMVLRVSAMPSARNVCMGIHRPKFEPRECYFDSSLTTALHVLASVGLESFFDTAYNADELTRQDQHGLTPCDHAIRSKHESTCLRLINLAMNAKLSLHLLTAEEDLLVASAELGWTEAVKILLARGTNPDQGKEREIDTALIRASMEGHEGIVADLLKAGADATCSEKSSGYNAFLAAVSGQRREIWPLFQTRPDFDPEARTKKGFSAAHLAALNNDVEGFKTLLKWGVQPSSMVEGQLGRDTAHFAAQRDCVGIINELLLLGYSMTDKDEHGWQPLHHAAHYGSLNALKAILASPGVSVTATCSKGDTAFHKAAAKGDTAILAALYEGEQNAENIARMNAVARTPLHLAAYSGHGQAVVWLLEHHAPIDAQESRSGSETPLLEALDGRHVDIARLLIERKAKVNCRGLSGAPAIHYAAKQGLSSMVEPIMAAGGKLNLVDDFKRTALHWACIQGFEDIAISLCEDYRGLDIEAIDEDGNTALLFAARTDCGKVLTYLIGKRSALLTPNNAGQHPIHVAARAGHVEVVKLLLAHDPGCALRTTKLNNTALYLASHSSRAGVVEILAPVSDVDHANEDGDLALVHAIRNKKFEIVRILLDHKANIHKPNGRGTTPFHAAVAAGSYFWVEKLLGFGCDPSIANILGLSPIMSALYNSDVIISEFLLKTLDICDLKKKTTLSESILISACLGGVLEQVTRICQLEHELHLIEAYNDLGQGPLHMAARKGHADVVEYLLQLEGRINDPDDKGQTPLQKAAEGRHLKVVQTLLQRTPSSRVDACDQISETTALIEATRSGGIQCAEALLLAGANPYIVDFSGRCAYDYAVMSERMLEMTRRFCEPHIPLEPAVRTQHLKTSVCRAIDAILQYSLKEGHPSHFWYLCYISDVFDSLVWLDAQNSVDEIASLYVAMSENNKADVFRYSTECAFCGRKDFSGDVHKCKTCPTVLCSRCFMTFQTERCRAPEAVKVAEKLEQDVWNLAGVVRAISDKQLIRTVQELQRNELVLRHIKKIQDANQKWESENDGASEKFLGRTFGGYLLRDRPGAKMLSILDEMLKGTSKQREEPWTEEVQEKTRKQLENFNAWKYQENSGELRLFECNGHKFCKIEQKKRQEVRANATIFDGRMRLKPEWLHHIRELCAPDESEPPLDLSLGRPSCKPRPDYIHSAPIIPYVEPCVLTYDRSEDPNSDWEVMTWDVEIQDENASQESTEGRTASKPLSTKWKMIVKADRDDESAIHCAYALRMADALDPGSSKSLLLTQNPYKPGKISIYEPMSSKSSTDPTDSQPDDVAQSATDGEIPPDAYNDTQERSMNAEKMHFDLKQALFQLTSFPVLVYVYIISVLQALFAWIT